MMINPYLEYGLVPVLSYLEMILDTVFRNLPLQFTTTHLPASAPRAILNALLSLLKPLVPLNHCTYFISKSSPSLSNKLNISVGLYPNLTQNLIVLRVSTTSGTTIFYSFFPGCASQKQALKHSFSELTSENSQERSKGPILGIDVLSGD